MKRIILFAFTCLVFTCVYSQSYRDGVGVGAFLASGNQFSQQTSYAITYSAKWNFAETKDAAWSVGIPLSMGGTNIANYPYKGSNVISFAADAPVLLNFNFGAGSSKVSRRQVGFFIGGGFGVNYTKVLKPNPYAFEQPQLTDLTTYGPVADAGIRFALNHSSFTNLELRIAYMKSIDATDAHILGLGIVGNF